MEELLLKRKMPQNIKAEKSVISAILMDSKSIVTATEIITPEDFYSAQYGILFRAMTELYKKGTPIDLLTLQEQLAKMDVPEELTSIEFFKDLLEFISTSANIEYHAKLVKEKSKLRNIIKATEEITDSCYLAKDSIEDILSETQKKVFNIVQTNSSGEFVPIKDVVIGAMEKIEAVSKTRGNVTGLPTGFIDLDYKTSGFQNSDLILIAARPSMGKTAFELNIAQYMAFRKNTTVAIFSLEMSNEQLVNRLFALESSVDSQKIRTGDLEDSDWERLIESANIIGNSNLIIDDTPGISITELSSKCRKYKMEHNLGIIIIDYLQLMTAGGKSESRQQEISEISRSLKSLARELNVPVVALSQLSRAVEKRDDKRPMLSDLRESGAIEQDADVVMFLYRDDYYNKDSDRKGIAEVIIAKQRNGPIGTVELLWLPNYTKFVNYESKKD